MNQTDNNSSSSDDTNGGGRGVGKLLSPGLLEEIKALRSKHVELLQPHTQDDDYDQFYKAIQLAWDFDEDGQDVIIDSFQNTDWLEYPEPPTSGWGSGGSSVQLNIFQLIFAGRYSYSEAFETTFVYLFDNTDYYGESWSRDKAAIRAIRAFRRKVSLKYRSAEEYVHRVESMLFLEPDTLSYSIGMVKHRCFNTNNNTEPPLSKKPKLEQQQQPECQL